MFLLFNAVDQIDRALCIHLDTHLDKDVLKRNILDLLVASSDIDRYCPVLSLAVSEDYDVWILVVLKGFDLFLHVLFRVVSLYI